MIKKLFFTASLLTVFSLQASPSVTILRQTCPVCSGSYQVPASGELGVEAEDIQLDFRVISPARHLPPLPVCNNCGLVVPSSPGSAAERTAWRAVTASPEYKALANRNEYRRLAHILERTDTASHEQIGMAYRHASWGEWDYSNIKEDLEKALFHAGKYQETLDRASQDWARAQYLRAEFLRRLSRFSEARSALRALEDKNFSLPVESLNPHVYIFDKDLESVDLGSLVGYQRMLCRWRDPAPRSLKEVKELKEGGFLFRLKKYFLAFLK